jgi:hypothetical protein
VPLVQVQEEDEVVPKYSAGAWWDEGEMIVDEGVYEAIGEEGPRHVGNTLSACG